MIFLTHYNNNNNNNNNKFIHAKIQRICTRQPFRSYEKNRIFLFFPRIYNNVNT
jgi:hypothetical protein